MLASRIIPCLDVTAGRVVKGVNFVELRDAGDPVDLQLTHEVDLRVLVHTLAETALEAVEGAVTSAVNTSLATLSSGINGLITTVTSGITAAINAIQTTVTDVISDIVSTVDSVWTFLQTLPDKAWTEIKNALNLLLDIKSDIKLPFLEAMERKNRAARLSAATRPASWMRYQSGSPPHHIGSCTSRRSARRKVRPVAGSRTADSLALRGFLGLGLDEVPPEHSTISRTRRLAAERRAAAEAKPSHVWRLPAQHQPTFGAPRFSLPSRPVPPLIQIAGVLASSPFAVRLRDPTVMKQALRSSCFGSCSSQAMPSLIVSGVRPRPVTTGNAASGLQFLISSPRSTSCTR